MSETNDAAVEEVVNIDGGTPEERLTYIKDVFGLIKNRNTRLTKGVANRKALIGFLSRNEEPTGPSSYRLDHIRTTANKIIRLLSETSKVFNLLHGDDLVTVADFGDILASVQNSFNNA